MLRKLAGCIAAAMAVGCGYGPEAPSGSTGGDDAPAPLCDEPLDRLALGGALDGELRLHAGCTYRLTEGLEVRPGGRLTAEPGAQLAISPGLAQGIEVDGGAIDLEGSRGSPVVVTSAAQVPAPGDHLGIRVGPTGHLVARHVLIDYGGAPTFRNEGSAIRLEGAGAVLDDVVIAHSAQYGIYVPAGGSQAPFASFARNRFVKSGEAAVVLPAAFAPLIGPDTCFASALDGECGTDPQARILLWGWQHPLSSQAALPALGIPFVLDSMLRITDGGALVLQGGTELRFRDQAGLTLDSGSAVLDLQGDEAHDTVLASDSPGAQWVVDARQGNLSIRHATFEGGGFTGSMAMLLLGPSASGAVEGNVFRQAQSSAVEIECGGSAGTDWRPVAGANRFEENRGPDVDYLHCPP